MIKSEIIDLGLKLSDTFTAQSVLTFERILRLHPNWFVTELNLDGDNFTANIKDYVTETSSHLSGLIEFSKKNDKILNIDLKGTIDINIRFYSIQNSLMVETISTDKIDPSDPVLLWIRAIREYIRLYVKKTMVTWFFRILMNRMVLQMNPSQRKICMMLVKITFVEILVIIFIIVGYTIFVL